MKIPDDLRQSVADVAEKVVGKSQQLSREAQLQVKLKKLQVEHARKIHELGKKTYEWHRSGKLIVTGPVPGDVVDLCRQLDDAQGQIDATQAEITAARQEARATPLAGTASKAVQVDAPPALGAPGDTS